MQEGLAFIGKVARWEPGSSQKAVFPLRFLLHVPALASFKDRVQSQDKISLFPSQAALGYGVYQGNRDQTWI